MPGLTLQASSRTDGMSSLLGEHPQYEEVAQIGNGAYGTVYKARNMRRPGEFVALKKIRVQTSQDDGMPMSTIREIALLKQLENFEHPNVVKLLDVCHGRRVNNELSLFLVFEHVDQDLEHYLRKCPPPGLGPDRIKDLMKQMMCGVDFLHTNRIVHRDLKPQNVLVTHDGRVKLADFGLARVYAFHMQLTSVVVTLWYRAPEVLLQAQYATAVDMWSLGCILAELHMRKPMFQGQSDIEMLHKIFDVIGLPPREDWPENVSLPWTSFTPCHRTPIEKHIPEIDPLAKDLLLKLLVFKQSVRLSARAALHHRWFLDEDDFHRSLHEVSLEEPLEVPPTPLAVTAGLTGVTAGVTQLTPPSVLSTQILACHGAGTAASRTPPSVASHPSPSTTPQAASPHTAPASHLVPHSHELPHMSSSQSYPHNASLAPVCALGNASPLNGPQLFTATAPSFAASPLQEAVTVASPLQIVNASPPFCPALLLALPAASGSEDLDSSESSTVSSSDEDSEAT